MRASQRTATLAFSFLVVLPALVAFVIWNKHTVRAHLAGMEQASRIIAAYHSPGPPLLRRPMSKSDKLAIFLHQSPEYWADSWSADQAALLRKGYLTKGVVLLRNPSFTMKQVRVNAGQLFPDSANIVGFALSTNQVLTITAPAKEMALWEQYISETDRRAP
jgi:hypothetical protein